MPAPIFDSRQVEQAQKRAQRHAQTPHSSKDHDFLFRRTARDIADRLLCIRRSFETALIIAPIGEGLITSMFKDTGKVGDLLLDTDLTAPRLDEPNTFDLIIRLFDLHRTDDVPGELKRTHNALRAGGVFLTAFPGDDTLQALRMALMQAEIDLRGGVSPRVHPMITRLQMTNLMQRARFDAPVVDVDHVDITYENIYALMRDIRYMGEGNALLSRRRSFTPRALFTRADEIYKTISNDFVAGVDIIHAIGWKKE